MKKYLSRISLRLSLLLLGIGVIWAQDLSSPLSRDSALRLGKLPNGLTYYIRQNAEPENRIELRLMVKAGSVDEAEDQQGMAHFTEHMLFNGTKSFPKNDVIEFLKTIGVSFGADLNAYTGLDRTVYFIHAPSDKLETVDKCFSLFKEWMSEVTFSEKEIDKERKVVLEEKRVRSTVDKRWLSGILPIIYKGSKYGERDPIGTEESLKNTPYAAIKRFYRDWYRPELMSFSIVGDLETDLMEKKVREYFSDLKNPSTPSRRREDPGISKWPEELYWIFKDQENIQDIYYALYRNDVFYTKNLKTDSDFRALLIGRLASGMFNKRMQEVAEKEQAPFISSASNVSATLLPTINGTLYYAILFPEKHEAGITAVQEEIQRAVTHGFTEGELELEKKRLLQHRKTRAENQEKAESREYADNYVSHFFEGRSDLMNDKQAYETVKKILLTITLKEINEAYRKYHTDRDEFYSLRLTDKATTTEAQLTSAVKAGKNASPTAYEFKKVTATSLMASLPRKGSVTSKKDIPEVGVTKIVLSNGASVILKPTDFEKNEILFSAEAKGGSSMLSEENVLSAEMLGLVMSRSGIGDFSRKELQDFLSGKIVNVSTNIGQYRHGLRGSSTPEDLETAMQLLHLNFTSVRRDEKSFKSLLKSLKTRAKGIKVHPLYSALVGMEQITYNNHPRRPRSIRTEEEIAKIELDKAIAAHKKAFSNAANFTFYFVGSFETDDILPLIEQYVASLPGDRNNLSKMIDHKVRMIEGPVEKKYEGGIEGSTYVFMSQAKYVPYVLKESDNVQLLNRLLSDRLLEKLREDEGGVYGASISVSFSETPVEHYTTGIAMPGDPKRVKKLIKFTKKEIKKIQKGKISAEDMQKIKERAIKDYEEEVRTNGFWMKALSSLEQRGMDYSLINNKVARTQAVTASELQQAAQKFIDIEKMLTFISEPKNK